MEERGELSFSQASGQDQSSEIFGRSAVVALTSADNPVLSFPRSVFHPPVATGERVCESAISATFTTRSPSSGRSVPTKVAVIKDRIES
jgi:hypothetical protein